MGVRTRFLTLAAYNRWANERLYAAAEGLRDDEYRRDLGAFFGSVHATLNHLLLVDRFWLERLDGRDPPRPALDTILYEPFEELKRARIEQDEIITRFLEALREQDFEGVVSYHTGSGSAQRNARNEVLTHLFNHQTHHRGQVHALITRLGYTAPELDYIYFLREAGA
jgi:uncharacterized damage-inducible protein DinB